ncbi:MAG: hypothetical protein ABIP19_06175 [Dermatophilaceae bacterium]
MDGGEDWLYGRLMAAPSTADLARELTDRCSALVRGRKVVLVGGVLAGATHRVRQLRAWGAGDILILAQGVGTGELPDPGAAQVTVVDDGKPSSLTEEVRSWEQFAADPPAAARQALEDFDPHGRALCLLSAFAHVDRYCGRESLGGRTPAIAALEDKTLNDALWDAAGVPRVPARVVPADRQRILEAARDLDSGDGTVWSADASDGMNGGGDRVRWVRTSADAEEALTLLLPRTRLVRLMPFLHGVPCSIHGFVLPDGVAVFRPVEQVILRSFADSRFVHAGISTWWDPADEDREQMREVARRVGRRLQESDDFRGGYSVDGILTRDGFRPTELNPRFAAGLSTIAKGVPGLPLELLQGSTVRGIDVGATAAGLESILVEAADANRYGSVYTMSRIAPPAETETLEVAGGPEELQAAGPDEAVVGVLEHGPATLGSLVRFTPSALTPGTRMAPYAVSAFALADRLWGTRFGDLEPALDVR